MLIRVEVVGLEALSTFQLLKRGREGEGGREGGRVGKGKVGGRKPGRRDGPPERSGAGE